MDEGKEPCRPAPPRKMSTQADQDKELEKRNNPKESKASSKQPWMQRACPQRSPAQPPQKLPKAPPKRYTVRKVPPKAAEAPQRGNNSGRNVRKATCVQQRSVMEIFNNKRGLDRYQDGAVVFSSKVNCW